MNEKHTFYQLLHSVTRQLRLEYAFKQLHYLLLTIFLYLTIIMLLMRTIVIVHFVFYMVIGTVLIIAIYLFFIWRNLPKNKDAAKLYDQYVGEERTQTALAFIDRDETIYLLQRKDAVTHMKQTEQTIRKRKKKLFYPFPLLAIFILALSTTLGVLYPNEKIQLAKQRQLELELVKEIEKNIKEEIKEEKDPLVKDQLESLLKKINQANNADQALEELVKQREELELKKIETKEQQRKLNDIVDALHSAGLNDLAEALKEQELEKFNELIHELQNKPAQLTDEQKQTLAQLANQSTAFTEETLAQLEKNIENLLNNMDKLNQVELAQQVIDQQIKQLYNRMLDNNIPPTNIAQNIPEQNQGQNGQNPSTNPTDPNGNNTSNQQGHSPNQGNNGNSSQSPGGNQQGNNGEGNNNQGGSNQGNNGAGGNSSGQSGTGGSYNNDGQSSTGAGLGSGSRELTVPETMDGDVNIEVDLGGLGTTDGPKEVKEGSGLVVKGSVRPYGEVYRKYEEANRKSIERIQLPSELETIVKNYFSNIKPD